MTDQPGTPETPSTPETPGTPDLPAAATSTDPMDVFVPGTPTVAAPGVEPGDAVAAVGGETPAAPGWYPVDADGGVRYWDGTQWRLPVPLEPVRATYGEKYKRRYKWVLLVIAGINIAFTLFFLASDQRLDLGTLSVNPWAFGIGIALGLFVSAAFWTLFVALFRGAPTDPAAPKPPILQRAWTWIPVALVGVAVVNAIHVTPKPAPEVTIASPAQACTAFLDTVEEAARQKATNAGIVQYLTQLKSAAETTAPEFAADLSASIASPTDANLQAATQSILTRCIKDGSLTTTQVQEWSAKVQKISSGG